jgi:uncharacterized membrane protein YesL
MGIFDPESNVYQAVGKVIDAIWLNIIWLIFQMPLIFIIFFSIATEGYFFLPLCCVAMIIAGPADTAFYYVVNKVIRHGRGYVWDEFWYCYRTSFKQSAIVSVILAALALLFAFDTYIMRLALDAGSDVGSIYVVFIVFMALEIMWALYLFPYMARFENGTKIIMKNCLLLVISYLPRTLLMFAVFAISLVVTYLIPLFICVLPVIFVLIQNALLEKVFRKYMDADDLLDEDQRNGIAY